MKETLFAAAMLATVTLVTAAAPATASHCSDIEDPTMNVDPDDDGDGKPDGLYVCVGDSEVGGVHVSQADVVNDANGDRYTYLSARAGTSYDSPIGTNYVDTFVWCHDQDNDMSGCDGYSINLYSGTYGTTGDFTLVRVYENANDEEPPRACVYSSVNDLGYTCQEL